MTKMAVNNRISTPKVSIVTATYNSMRFFHETVQNVLHSTLEDIEWILVDDASDDGTVDYLKTISDPRVKLIFKDQNIGVHDSYKMGINAALGTYLLILDHDDTIPDGSLEKRVQLLDRNPQCGLAFGPVNYMTEDGVIYSTSGFWFIKSEKILTPFITLNEIFLSPAYPIKQGCVLLRREAVLNRPGAFDVELFLDISSKMEVCCMTDPCLNYRTFRGQRSAGLMLRLHRFFQFIWPKYAFRFLPWYISPVIAFYRTIMELLKIVWITFSTRRV